MGKRSHAFFIGVWEWQCQGKCNDSIPAHLEKPRWRGSQRVWRKSLRRVLSEGICGAFGGIEIHVCNAVVVFHQRNQFPSWAPKYQVATHMACILSSLVFLDHGLMLIQCPRIDVFFISCGAIACDICSSKHSCRHVFSSAVVTLGLAGCRHTSSGIFSKTDRTSWLGTETTPTFFLPSLWKRMVALSSKRPQAAILWKCLSCMRTRRTEPSNS